MRTLGAGLCLLLGLSFTPAVRAAEPAPPTDVERLVRALDEAHEPTARLARALGTLAGRAALLEAAEAAGERSARARRDAVRTPAGRTHQVGPSVAGWLEERLEAWTTDVALLGGAVGNLRRGLAGNDVITSDLRAFLAREDAARTLYRMLVRPRLRPLALQAALARCLASNDAGRLFVPSALAPNAEQVLARDAAVVRALARLREAGPALRRRLDDEAPGWSGVDLERETWLTALLHASGGWQEEPEAVAEALVAWSVGSAPPPAALRLRVAVRLGDLQEMARVARAYAARLADDRALDPWRDLLGSPRALLLSPGGRLEQGKPVDVLLNRTGLGRALVTSPGGTVRVNPHALWDLDRILCALRKDADELASRGVRSIPDDLMLEIATREAQATPVEPLEAWIEEALVATPSGLRVRDGLDLEPLLASETATQAALAAPASRVVLDPGALDHQVDALDLLRSSIFYNPRTGYGHRVYVTEFEDHHAARLFGTFGWNAKVSQDLADFKRRIRAQQKHLQQLARVHDKLIVHISGVPPWLSSWTGTGTFEGGGWEDKQAHPPRDVAVWQAMIRELALVFREVEGVERYYEFWNEPDLEYWQGSLAEFLALYEATVKTIREVDPEGRIGGPAVNQWDGRIHKKTGSDVLVHELIRFAARRALPLDFVSWHHFGRPVAAIREAKASYAAELAKHGFDPDAVELLVTEWSAPGRGTPYGNVSFAETMLGLFDARVDAQTASCWEEFHAKPDPKGFPPWGLMTQQGERHGTGYVHRFFDRLARGSRGVAVVRPDDETTVVVSKKDDSVFDLLVWRTGIHPPLLAALRVLDEAKIDRPKRRWFGTTDRLERALREGEPVPVAWPEAFAAAREAFAAADPGPERLVLELAGADAVDVLFAESVRTEHALKRVAVLGNVLTCPLARYEVLRLRVRVR